MPKLKLMPRKVDVPTPEMVRFYHQRTGRHIQAVRRHLLTLSDWYDVDKQLVLQRCENHDLTKFSISEFTPYTYLTWQKKMEAQNKSFVLGSAVQVKINAAVVHHYKHNSHHPEYFSSAEDMEFIDMMEMVADWAACSEESGTPLLGWYKDVCVKDKRWAFSHKQLRHIRSLIDIFKERL